MKKIAVLYHCNCLDGFGAAWAAWRKFGKRADYFGIRPSQTADQLKGLNLKGREEIYFLDVSASAPVLRGLVKNNGSVTVIDHHISNRRVIRNANQWLFDDRHSGAVLASQFFFSKKPVFWLLRYIEDMDLWKFRLPHTRKIIAWLEFYPMEFRVWDKLAGWLEKAAFRKKVISEGKMFLKYENRLIADILKYAQEVKLMGHRARVVNSPIFQSELGNLLLDSRHRLSIIWSEVADGVRVSLRSDGEVDVSKLAAKFPGGGGHKRAAGFSLPPGKELPWKRIRK